MNNKEFWHLLHNLYVECWHQHYHKYQPEMLNDIHIIQMNKTVMWEYQVGQFEAHRRQAQAGLYCANVPALVRFDVIIAGVNRGINVTNVTRCHGAARHRVTVWRAISCGDGDTGLSSGITRRHDSYLHGRTVDNEDRQEILCLLNKKCDAHINSHYQCWTESCWDGKCKKWGKMNNLPISPTQPRESLKNDPLVSCGLWH